MFDLALHAQKTPQPIKAIAERENVPEAYLEQLIGVLRKEGLVKSVRGAQGGYMLNRPAGEITVGNVLRALDKAEPVRFSHENPDVMALYRDYLGTPMSTKAHHLLHTDHHGWKMPSGT